MKKRRGNSNSDPSLTIGIISAFGGLVLAALVCMMFNIGEPSRLFAILLWLGGAWIIRMIMDLIFYTYE